MPSPPGAEGCATTPQACTRDDAGFEAPQSLGRLVAVRQSYLWRRTDTPAWQSKFAYTCSSAVTPAAATSSMSLAYKVCWAPSAPSGSAPFGHHSPLDLATSLGIDPLDSRNNVRLSVCHRHHLCLPRCVEHWYAPALLKRRKYQPRQLLTAPRCQRCRQLLGHFGRFSIGVLHTGHVSCLHHGVLWRSRRRCPRG